MLGNDDRTDVRKRIDELCSLSPFFETVLSLAREHREPFAIDPELEGLDLHAENRVKERPNRARFKLFFLSTGRLAIFFYKRSLLPYSRDRFSYGGRVFDPKVVAGSEITNWLDFLAAGMPPDHRPGKLLRGFPYDVPQ